VIEGAFSRGDRCFVSSDVVRRDPDGDTWFVDALSGFVRTESGAVSTREIEDALYGMPEVELCAAWAVGEKRPGGRRGLRLARGDRAEAHRRGPRSPAPRRAPGLGAPARRRSPGRAWGSMARGGARSARAGRGRARRRGRRQAGGTTCAAATIGAMCSGVSPRAYDFRLRDRRAPWGRARSSSMSERDEEVTSAKRGT
jgi:acyl-CoA synthetase (AMP-forming)/AMP-acid ligase II